MATLATVSKKLDKLVQDFTLFSEVYKVNQESQNEQFLAWKMYLEKDVKKALNGQAEVLDIVKEQDEEILRLKLKDASCPVHEIMERVKVIDEETKEVRATYKYPDIRKGMKIYNYVLFGSAILSATTAFVVFIMYIKTLSGK